MAAPLFNDFLSQVLLIRDASIRGAINDQGLNDFTDLLSLTETDVEEICSNVRKPGGMMLNPNANARNNQPLMIANPGLPLGHLYEKRLKMLRYFMYHLKRIQRLPFNAFGVNMNDITTVYMLKESDKNEDDVALPSQFQRIDNARVTLENLDDYLYRKRGELGIPLSYVVRKIVELPARADDPGFGRPSFVEEMIRRAPHVGPEWQIDNLTVWNTIRHVTHDSIAWNWVSKFQRTGNGREAYNSLLKHYMGDSYQERIRSQADAKIESAFYDGRNRNFTFESYCGLLNNAFADLEATGEAVNEQRKVRNLLKNLKDPNLEAARAHVVANQTTITFEEAVNYISQFIDARRSLEARSNQRNVSSANSTSGRTNRNAGRSNNSGRSVGSNSNRSRNTQNTNRSGRGRNNYRGGGGRTNNNNSNSGYANPGQYLSDQDWANLTGPQRDTLRAQRAAYAAANPNRRTNTNTAADTRSVRQRVIQIPETPSVVTDLTAPTVPNTVYQSNIGAIMSRRQTNPGQQQQQAPFFD